jgi:hypothetical protein
MAEKNKKASSKAIKQPMRSARPQTAPRPESTAPVAESAPAAGEDAPPVFGTLLEAARWVREEREKGRLWRVVRTGQGWLAKPL